MAYTAEGTSKFVQAGDVKVHCHEAGSGPALICIHGGAPGAFGWGNFGYNMDALAANFRTVIVDLPGYGKSDKPAIEGPRYAFYARVFKDMMAAMGIARAHILGMATGGGPAALMAIHYPEIVERLVLVSAAGGVSLFSPTPSEGQKVIGGYYAGAGPSLEKMRRYLETIIYDPAKITDAIVQERYEASIQPEFMTQAPEGRGGATSVNEPVWKDMDKITQKTLVLWGRDNRVQGYDNALFMLQRIANVEVHIFGKTGLWIPWEQPAAFNELVTGFLKRP